MAEKRRRRGIGTNWLPWLGLLVLALLILRALGPGGLRPRELIGLDPAPGEAGGPSPGPAEGPAPASPAPSPAPDPSPPSLSGRVFSAAGPPVEGVAVEALFTLPGEDLPVVREAGPTGPDGAFAVKDPPLGWTGLRLRAHRGPLRVEADLEEAAGAGPLSLDLRLPADFAVAGILLAAEDGRPLPGMTVALGERRAATDRLGRFAFDPLPASLLDAALPDLEVTGAGRRPLRSPLPPDGPWDDLLLRVEAE